MQASRFEDETNSVNVWTTWRCCGEKQGCDAFCTQKNGW
jgi:hypothetical protein